MHLAQAESLEAGMMNTPGFPTVALCRSVVFAACVAALPAGVGLAEIASTRAAPPIDRAPPLANNVEPAEGPQVTATDRTVSETDAAATPALESPTAAETAAGPDGMAIAGDPMAAAETTSSRSSDMLPAEPPPAQVTTASRE